MKEMFLREVRIWVPSNLLQTIDKSIYEYGGCRAGFIQDAIAEKVDRDALEFRLRNQSEIVPLLSLF